MTMMASVRLILCQTVESDDLDCDDDGEGKTSEPATDCDDSTSAVNPSAAAEIIDDGIDQDCDSKFGDLCYVDGDSDGFGHRNTTLTVESDDLDCDDDGTERPQNRQPIATTTVILHL